MKKLALILIIVSLLVVCNENCNPGSKLNTVSFVEYGNIIEIYQGDDQSTYVIEYQNEQFTIDSELEYGPLDPVMLRFVFDVYNLGIYKLVGVSIITN